MSEPAVSVHVDATELAAVAATIAGGVIVIPVADLPAGSTISLSITIGPPPPRDPTPDPASRPRHLGTRQG